MNSKELKKEQSILEQVLASASKDLAKLDPSNPVNNQMLADFFGVSKATLLKYLRNGVVDVQQNRYCHLAAYCFKNQIIPSEDIDLYSKDPNYQLFKEYYNPLTRKVEAELVAYYQNKNPHYFQDIPSRSLNRYLFEDSKATKLYYKLLEIKEPYENGKTTREVLEEISKERERYCVTHKIEYPIKLLSLIEALKSDDSIPYSKNNYAKKSSLNKNEIGKIGEKYRQDHNLSLEDFATLVGVGAKHIYRMETGQRTFSYAYLNFLIKEKYLTKEKIKNLYQQGLLDEQSYSNFLNYKSKKTATVNPHKEISYTLEGKIFKELFTKVLLKKEVNNNQYQLNRPKINKIISNKAPFTKEAYDLILHYLPNKKGEFQELYQARRKFLTTFEKYEEDSYRAIIDEKDQKYFENIPNLRFEILKGKLYAIMGGKELDIMQRSNAALKASLEEN